MLGGASNSTTPSRVVMNAEFVVAVRDPVQVPLDAPDVVPLLVDRWAERCLGDRRIVRQCCRTGSAVGG
jgi:hypothetical protein